MYFSNEVDAILKQDIVEIRSGFDRIALTRAADNDPLLQSLVLAELCHALSGDFGLMPPAMCMFFELPDGSTYAEGVRQIDSLPDMGAHPHPSVGDTASR